MTFWFDRGEKILEYMKCLIQPVSFKLITACIFVIHASACFAGYLILGPSTFIDGNVLGLMLLMDFSFVVALVMATKENVAHILVLGWMALIFFCLRLAILLLFPLSAIDFLTNDPLTSQEIFRGLSFIALGFVAIFLGIFSCTHSFADRKTRFIFSGAQPTIYALCVYWFIAYLVAYYVRVYLEVTVFGAPEHWGNRMAWVGIIFDTDVALVFTICWGTLEWRKRELKRFEILILVVLVAMWLIFSMVIGSRVGPLRVLNFIFFAALACNPVFKLSISRFLVLFSAFFVINIHAFQVGSIFRASSLGATDSTSAVDRYQTIPRDRIDSLQANLSELRRSYNRSELINNLASYARPIAKRLAIIDYPLIIITRPANEEVLDYYIRSLHPIKNYINNMVPGEIFKESMVNTSRIFTMAYRDRSLSAINEGFLSEPWTIWGMAWILAGYGGLLILFCAAFILQLGYRLLTANVDCTGVYVRCVYFIIPLNIGYHMFGVDHWLTAVTHFSLACVIAYVSMLFVDRIFTCLNTWRTTTSSSNK
jgi:hypothetical protein